MGVELKNVLTVHFKLIPTESGIPEITLGFNYEEAHITHYIYDSSGQNIGSTVVVLDTN